MSNEDRSANARGPQHATHYDDCGCQSANYEKRLAAQKEAVASLEDRIATLEADYQTARTAVEVEAALVREARAKVATLEAERDRLWRVLCEDKAHAATLREALVKVMPHTLIGSDASRVAYEAACAALLATPAQSLAAHDAEVLERAGNLCDERKSFYDGLAEQARAEAEADAESEGGEASTVDGDFYEEKAGVCHQLANAIRALAAQAQEVTK